MSPLVLRGISQRQAWSHVAGRLVSTHNGQYSPRIDSKVLKDVPVSTDPRISMWLIDENKVNLITVVCALALTREKLDDYSYVLFPYSLLDDLEVRREHSEGDTPYSPANSHHFHLVDLSLYQLGELIRRICSIKPTSIGMLRRVEITSEIRKPQCKAQIDLGLLKPKVRAVIEQP